MDGLFSSSQILPWLGLLIVLNLAEVILLIGLTARLRGERARILDQVEARLLEFENERS
jgi:hypothetical protein